MDHLNETLLEQIREVKPTREDKKKAKQEDSQPLLSTPHLRTKEEEAEMAKSYAYIKKKEDEEKAIKLETFAKDVSFFFFENNPNFIFLTQQQHRAMNQVSFWNSYS